SSEEAKEWLDKHEPSGTNATTAPSVLAAQEHIADPTPIDTVDTHDPKPAARESPPSPTRTTQASSTASRHNRQSGGHVAAETIPQTIIRTHLESMKITGLEMSSISQASASASTSASE